MTYHLQPSRLIVGLLLLSAALFPGGNLQAKKLQAICGRVFLQSGDTIEAVGETRLTPPAKHKKLEIINNAYTKRRKVASRLKPETVDSAVVWSATSPEHPHTLIYLKDYGWCQQLEHNDHITVCCFSPKGYFLSGNGGIWMRGKGVMLVVKDGEIYNFGKTYNKINNSARRRLETLVADDPALSAYFHTAIGRCDKVVRALGRYNPEK